MRVLVTGGTGFIGSHVVDLLVETGMEVVVFDPLPERLRLPLPGVRYVVGDLRDSALVESVLSQGVGSVVHLASATVPQTSTAKPDLELQNLAAALSLFQACAKQKIRKIVFSSSGGTVYGIPASIPVGEEHATNPVCSYGVTKLAIEKYLQCYSHMYGLQQVILRVSNPYGVRQRLDGAQGVIPVFVSRMMEGKEVVIWGDGTAVRDFIHVQDIARLCLLALVSDATGVFNAGSGVGVSVNQILQQVSSHLAMEPKIVRQPSRKFDVPAIVLDCQKARRVYSWGSQLTLSQGIAELADWLRRNPLHSVAKAGERN